MLLRQVEGHIYSEKEEKIRMKGKLSGSELMIFCEQMALILKTGLSVTEGVMIMRDDAEEAPDIRALYEELYAKVEETGFLCQALEEMSVFPDYMVQMVKIGEQTGNLDEVMASLAANYEREEQMMRDIKSAVTYPFVMLGMMLVILLVMLVKVLPVFNQVYEQLGSAITGPAAFLLKLGEGIRNHYGVVLFLIILAALALAGVFHTERGKEFFRRMIGRIFGAGRLSSLVGVSRFSAGISMALRSGLDYEGAFFLVSDLMVEDEKMKEKILECQKRMTEGESLAEAAVQVHIFNGMNARLLQIAERTGETSEALEKIARQTDEEITLQIQNMVSVLEPTLVAALSVLVGGMLLSVLIPLMSILSSIG